MRRYVVLLVLCYFKYIYIKGVKIVRNYVFVLNKVSSFNFLCLIIYNFLRIGVYVIEFIMLVFYFYKNFI